MLAYHDLEWGVPVRDDRGLFELLTLEGAQAGLSWSLVLAKRQGYRQAFAGFAPDLVARFDDAEVERLVGDAFDRAQPPEDRVHGVQRPRHRRHAPCRRHPGRAAVVVRLRRDPSQCVDRPQRAPLIDAHVQGHERRTAPPRFPVRGPRDVLLHHAGGGAGERPRDVVPPVGGAGRGTRVGVVTDATPRAPPTSPRPTARPAEPDGPPPPSPRTAAKRRSTRPSDESFPASDAPQWWSGEPDDRDT